MAIFLRPNLHVQASCLGSWMASANKAVLNDILTLYQVDLHLRPWGRGSVADSGCPLNVPHFVS
jgi:hypothetical protein